MSANFTPEELKKFAPDEYNRIYGEDKPKKPEDEADTNRAKLDEARLLNPIGGVLPNISLTSFLYKLHYKKL